MPPDEDVLGGEQQLFDRRGDAALEQHRLAHQAEFAQQVEVLHVARAHLEAIDVGQHQLDLGNLHDLADDEQAGCVTDFAQQLEAGESHALEGIWRAARLECASAKKLRAGRLDLRGDGEYLVAAFDGAGAGHDDDFFPANGDAVGKLDDGAFGTEAAPGEFVRRRDANDFGHAGQQFEILVIELSRECLHRPVWFAQLR